MENSKKSIVILAGGLGSRYQGLKQIDGILPNNATLLEYSIFDAIKAGFNKIVFIINESITESYIERLSGILSSKNVGFHWIIQDKKDFVSDDNLLKQRTKPWGTAHAVLCAEKVVRENFVVINADDYYGSEVYKIAATLIDEGKINANNYAAILYPLKNTLSKNGSVSRGKCVVNDENKLVSIHELTNIFEEENSIFYSDKENVKHDLAPNILVSMNFWILNPSIFNYLKMDFTQFINKQPEKTAEIYLPAVIDSLIQNKAVEVSVEVSPEQWKGVTYAEDKAELQEFLKQKIKDNIYTEDLWIQK
ncbi:nucleotidyltransferase family protein [Kaistella antarctica]|uniref:UDP-N-acetylglucosamine diphosphorylase/glucosamine-1-phosphate N-acetyltransferase n=1 Tax=Kaistella antarctica TaxID=266748 RepID=A0A448NMB3_9FLAO|nr:sugar phosphate nucleotidyltransferase [Kaistella antarctica]KEY20146.1 hypothetical protein HY04_02730 [Kaistella antarctica]SEV93128.1 UTP-glucose-1-phosphate uridylyltransferase [Kaistella antarctica]VEH95112.1 UDP-N-acetylglucosamine diphosphorylase/glucosamine-1-phosphate N-acetyltransferase [Kaistella antarctica]